MQLAQPSHSIQIEGRLGNDGNKDDGQVRIQVHQSRRSAGRLERVETNSRHGSIGQPEPGVFQISNPGRYGCGW
jgi:hypothetical protein